MGLLETAFSERLAEVEAYLQFLDELEAPANLGAPRIGGSGTPLSPLQIHILRAGVFVQLYNLVESTMAGCLEALSNASWSGGWRASDLNPHFRTEWVRVTVGSNKEMNADNRLRYAVALTTTLVEARPIAEFQLEKGGGGNWSDTHIEQVLGKLGMNLRLTPAVRAAAKRNYRNGLGPLALVVKLRNDLAHGTISFKECGQGETITGLREISHGTAIYIRSIVRAVERFIDRHEYLVPERRPA